MGMSASQARLIALTERMNDIEYQGQQINQQRTTLSNQCNALYNSLLDMEVPTPPSTQDFTKTTYSGVVNATKFNMGTVTPNGTDSNGKTLYNVNLNFQNQGLAVGKSMYTANAIYTPEKIKVSSAIGKNSIAQQVLQSENSYIQTTQATDSDLSKTGTDIYVKLTKTQYVDNKDDLNALGVYSTTTENELKEIDEKDIGDPVYVKINASVLIIDGEPTPLADKLGLTTVTGEEKTLSTNNLFTGETVKRTETKEGNITEEDAKILINCGTSFYIANDDGKYKKVTAEDLSKMTYQDLAENLCVIDTASGTEVYNAEYQNGTTYSIRNGNDGFIKIYDTVEDAKSELSTNYGQYITALHHSFPDVPESDIPKKFKVYFTNDGGQNVPHFVPAEEFSKLGDADQISNLTVYEFDEDGTYEDKQLNEGCYLEFDSDGQISKIGIPQKTSDGSIKGYTWVDLTVSTVADDAAYKDAFNKYEYNKALYDKKQQEINAKTSIIQAEDKSLELKLTRLDNERNAVNTELEAVKKVVSDNIQKSFKTFSG